MGGGDGAGDDGGLDGGGLGGLGGDGGTEGGEGKEGGDGGGKGQPAVTTGSVSEPSIVGNSRLSSSAPTCAVLSAALKTNTSCMMPVKRSQLDQLEWPTYRRDLEVALGRPTPFPLW